MVVIGGYSALMDALGYGDRKNEYGIQRYARVARSGLRRIGLKPNWDIINSAQTNASTNTPEERTPIFIRGDGYDLTGTDKYRLTGSEC